MALNDIISSALEKIGFKKSEIEKCREAIALHEECIRDLNDDLHAKFEASQELERALRDMKVKYNAASPASKKLLESQIRSLMRDFSGMKELQDIVVRNIEKEKLLLRNRRVELEHLRHPSDVRTIADAQDRKEEIISDLEEEDAEIEGLSGCTYRRDESFRTSVADCAVPAAETDSLIREIDSLIGEDAPEPVAEEGESPDSDSSKEMLQEA